MAHVYFDFEKYDAEITELSMERIESAAHVIASRAKSILKGKLVGNWKEHGPYATGQYAGKAWTARRHGAMVNTIRVVRKQGVNNVWVMAGNKETWWAVQLEYGRGSWRGGAKPFMRPAMNGAMSEIKAALEGGSGPREVTTGLSLAGGRV